MPHNDLLLTDVDYSPSATTAAVALIRSHKNQLPLAGRLLFLGWFLLQVKDRRIYLEIFF